MLQRLIQFGGLRAPHTLVTTMPLQNDDGNKQPGNLSSEKSTSLQAPNPMPTTGDRIGMLRWYYSRLFPSTSFVRWLRYGRNEIFSRREISFTLPGDIYLRWKSFNDESEFLKELEAKIPIKIDIGAIYNSKPATKNSILGALIPQTKELVFDIDLTDYMDVLGEMAGGSPVDECDRCWPLMATAVKVVDMALREDFGFQHILWVYSGRRGIHCWVADARARRLNNEQRSSIADFLHIRFESQDNAGKRQTDVTVPMHPSLARARNTCASTFHDFSLQQAAILGDDARVSAVAAHLASRPVALDVADRVNRMSTTAGGATPSAKWERFEREVNRIGRNEWAVRGACDYIVLRHTYPRLDANVTREINHLLKAPFSVHPKTNRVCVPFLADQVDDFHPEVDAPTLDALHSEMNAGVDIATRKMKKAVDIFEQFVHKVEQEAMDGLKASRLNEIDSKAALELLAH